MAGAEVSHPKPFPVTLRAVLIALVLIPPNVLFVLHGLMWGESRSDTGRARVVGWPVPLWSFQRS